MTARETEKTVQLDPEIATKVGVIGTGFIAANLVHNLLRREDWTLSRVLTRRPVDQVEGFPAAEALTDSIDELIDRSDVIIECTGDVLWASHTIGRCLEAKLPVVTYNPEFHVTTGSHYVDRGFLTEAEGDQPGSIAALYEDVVEMGFEPLVLGNMKRFLNRDPTPDEMAFWAAKQHISLTMVTEFTDGTKLQIEQCLVGNYFGADIAQEELLGPQLDDLNEVAQTLGAAADAHGRLITDYMLSSTSPHGVFIVGRHQPDQMQPLNYLKMGDGPYYMLVYPSVLAHLEIFKTLARLRRGQSVLLNNAEAPGISVAALAKRPLAAGEKIPRGTGSFDLRGICVRNADRPDHLPIGLAQDMVVRRAVEPGQILTMEDVDLPQSEALDAWTTISHRFETASKAIA